MRKQVVIIHLVLVGVVVFLAGCQKPKTTSATPKPKPTPPPLSAVSTGVNLTVFDKKGQPALGLKAATAGANTVENTGTMVVQEGNATLFQKGKAVATLVAKKIAAQTTSRTIEATGSVVVKSLTQSNSPTIHADKIVWEHDKNLLTGTGNVLVTAEPAYSLPAESFTADTKLSHYKLKLGTTPGTGTY